jgi:hypothetical protein
MIMNKTSLKGNEYFANTVPARAEVIRTAIVDTLATKTLFIKYRTTGIRWDILLKFSRVDVFGRNVGGTDRISRSVLSAVRNIQRNGNSIKITPISKKT